MLRWRKRYTLGRFKHIQRAFWCISSRRLKECAIPLDPSLAARLKRHTSLQGRDALTTLTSSGLAPACRTANLDMTYVYLMLSVLWGRFGAEVVGWFDRVSLSGANFVRVTIHERADLGHVDLFVSGRCSITTAHFFYFSLCDTSTSSTNLHPEPHCALLDER